MPLTNAPLKYEYNELPDGWAKTVDTQVFSKSSSATVDYNTPKYTGRINWCYGDIYGDLPTNFTFNGERLYACDGHNFHTLLNIPEDYCIRTGKDGWMKMITREYFEMWLQKP